VGKVGTTRNKNKKEKICPRGRVNRKKKTHSKKNKNKGERTISEINSSVRNIL
jgi:hypothetical protein